MRTANHIIKANLTAVLILLLASISMANNKQVLHGYIQASVLKKVQLIKPLPDTTRLNLQIGLSLRNGNELNNLIQEIYDPGSPEYRHYLTSDQFTEMFCPIEQDYHKVIDYMKSKGLEVTGTYPNRIVIDVSGAVSDIDRIFNVKINLYRDLSKSRTFYAPDKQAEIEGLDVPIQDVIGLDNYAPPRPIDLRKRVPGEKVETTGSGPGGLFIGNDYRAAYAPGVTLNGKGQVVGLFEFGPYWINDITSYEDQAGIPHVPISNVLLDKMSATPKAGEDVGEESLDIENALAIAPGASFIVYIGNSAVDILSAIASDNKAKQISCSFGWYPPSSTENQLYQQLVAQGQDFFVASGDGGAYPDTVQIFSPTDNTNITCVGGTDLVTAGPGGTWKSESAWNGSGGGISKTFISPNYQIGIANTSNQGSKIYRNFPDVSATAAFQFYFVYNNGKSGGIGGTSGAAPLWAGYLALVNEQAALNGKPGAGFINPAIYSIGKGQSYNYNPDFHDITAGNNMSNRSPDKFSSVSGYDLVTGWGSPDGIYLINALAGIKNPDFSLSLPNQSLTVNQFSETQFSLSTTPLNGFNGAVKLSASNLPDGVTADFTAQNSAEVMNLKVSADANTGTYTFLITGVSDSLAHSIPVDLIINAAPTAVTQINISSYYNRFNGIAADGKSFQGGLDNSGYAYSASLLGTSVNWNNTSFSLGKPNAADAISAQGQTIQFPQGNYASLRMLATGVNGSQNAQKFKVYYSDSTASVVQSFSDWYSPSYFAGENIAVTMPYRLTASGSKDNRTFYLYGYSFKLNPLKALNSITLPVNQNLEILAITLAAPLTDTSLIPSSFVLNQNFPNPFNLTTEITYKLHSSAFVTLKIYDILGREIETLVSSRQNAGNYSVYLNGANLASGVYFYRLQADSFVDTKKLILLK